MQRNFCYDGFQIVNNVDNATVYFPNLCVLQIDWGLERLTRFCRRLRDAEGISFLVYDRENYNEVVIMSKLIEADSSEGRYVMNLFNICEDYKKSIIFENAWLSELTNPINGVYFIMTPEEEIVENEPKDIISRYQFVRKYFIKDQSQLHTPHQCNRIDHFDYANR